MLTSVLATLFSIFVATLVKIFKARNTWCYVKNNVGYSWEYLFVWLISHQLTLLFSQNKPATSNQPVVLFSQNKSASATSQTSQ
jgi:hypothetical protein